MKLKDLAIFKSETFRLCYEGSSSYCATESFESESEWFEEIVTKYGEVEIEYLTTSPSPFRIEVSVIIPKEVCFQISYEIMNVIMVEDERKEIA